MRMSIATKVVDYVKNDDSQDAVLFMSSPSFDSNISDAIDAGIVREKYTNVRDLYMSLVLTPLGCSIASKFNI